MAQLLNASKIHYIVLVQTVDETGSRTFSEFESLTACIEGIVSMYDDFLKELFPHEPVIQYDLAAHVKFFHKFKDLSCLAYDHKYNIYRPYGKDWILEQIYKHLKKQSENVGQ